MLIVKPADNRPVTPEAFVASAKIVCLPAASGGLTRNQRPYALAVVVPRMVSPSRIVTTLPAVARPAKMGGPIMTVVPPMRNPLMSTGVEAIGDEPTSGSLKTFDRALVLPAWSMATAEKL